MVTVIARPPYFPGAGANSSTLTHFPNTFYVPLNPARRRCSVRGLYFPLVFKQELWGGFSVRIYKTKGISMKITAFHFFNKSYVICIPLLGQIPAISKRSACVGHFDLFFKVFSSFWASCLSFSLSRIRLDSHRPDFGSTWC